MIVRGTPVEWHEIDGKRFMVKREDLSCSPPGPPFSKMRGLYDHMKLLKARNVQRVAYVETAISMAGWGVAVVGQQLGIPVTIFEPQYKNPPPVFLFHKSKWQEFGAEIRPIRGDVMAKVAWNMAKSWLRDNSPQTVLFPLGISFPESITATAAELAETWNSVEKNPPSAIVLAVGSGTIASGILQGFQRFTCDGANLPVVYGVMTRSSDEWRKTRKMMNMGKVSKVGFLKTAEFHLVDAGYNYSDGVNRDVPFPINRWYDAKALAWMLDNYANLPQPLLFWNIGSEADQKHNAPAEANYARTTP